MPPELSGPRLTLRPLAAVDEAFYCAIYTDATLMAQIGAALSAQAARRAFAAALKTNADGDPPSGYWIVVERGLCRDIGLLGLVAGRRDRPGLSVGSPDDSSARPAPAGSAEPEAPAQCTTGTTAPGVVAEPAPAEAEVGAIILPAWHSCGYAAEAIAMLAGHAFATSSCLRLHTRHAPGNAAAIGLMQKLGFAPVASAADRPFGYRWELRRAHWQHRRPGIAAPP